MGRGRVLAAGVVMVVLIVGCGGPSDSGVTKASTETTAEAVTTAPTFSGKGSPQFCRLAKSYNERLAGLASKISDPSQLSPYLEELASVVEQAVAVAPSEITTDVKVLAGAVTGYVNALEKANYDYTKLPPEARDTIQSPDVQAASTRVSAYAKNVCGVTS